MSEAQKKVQVTLHSGCSSQVPDQLILNKDRWSSPSHTSFRPRYLGYNRGISEVSALMQPSFIVVSCLDCDLPPTVYIAYVQVALIVVSL